MSSSKAFILAAGSSILTLVAAHGHVSGIVTDGTYSQGYNPRVQFQQPSPSVAGWSDSKNLFNGFVSDYTSNDMICHLGATPGQAYATVAAGDQIELQWTKWPGSHHGPIISYLASCDGDCTDVDKTALKWNKIDEVGLIDGSVVPGSWASDKMIANNNTWALTIPSSIAAGNYVLRHETIALHKAGTAGGAQHYPQCVNLEITGGGSDKLPGGTFGTALYTVTDPGILVNIYQSLTSYIIPGPALIAGAGGSDTDNSPSKIVSAAVSATATGSFAITTTQVPTTLQTATRSRTYSVTVSSSVSTNIAVISSTTAVATPTESNTAPRLSLTVQSQMVLVLHESLPVTRWKSRLSRPYARAKDLRA